MKYKLLFQRIVVGRHTGRYTAHVLAKTESDVRTGARRRYAGMPASGRARTGHILALQRHRDFDYGLGEG